MDNKFSKEDVSFEILEKQEKEENKNILTIEDECVSWIGSTLHTENLESTLNYSTTEVDEINIEYLENTLFNTNNQLDLTLTNKIENVDHLIEKIEKKFKRRMKKKGILCNLQTHFKNVYAEKEVIELIGDNIVAGLENLVTYASNFSKNNLPTFKLNFRTQDDILIITILCDELGIDIKKLKNNLLEMTPLSNRDSFYSFTDNLFEVSYKERQTQLFNDKNDISFSKKIIKLSGAVLFNNDPQQLGIEIRIPVSLNYINSVLVEIEGEVYGLPLTSVIDRKGISLEDISSYDSGEYLIENANSIIKLVSPFSSWPGMKFTTLNKTSLEILVIGVEDKRFGIPVDKVLRREKLIYAPIMEGSVYEGEEIVGATITTKNEVVIFLNVERLLEQKFEEFTNENITYSYPLHNIILEKTV